MSKQSQSPAEEILSMIENFVSNNDSDLDELKMNEIDARVYCFINRLEFVRMNDFKPKSYVRMFDGRPLTIGYSQTAPEYTRNREALKSIRPYGFNYLSYKMDKEYWIEYREIGSGESFESPRLDSEEFAELHVIIQAINYLRGGL